MTYNKEYTLHNGQKIYVQYNEYNVCQVTKDCIEMLLDLYQQGRVDAIDEAKKRNSTSSERLCTSRSTNIPR